MSWLQLKLNSHPEQVEVIAELLDGAGAAAVTFQDAEDQPLYEPAPGSTPLWKHTEITGLFPADCNLDTLLLRLQQQAETTPIKWQIQPLEDKEWTQVCMDDFHPMQFGERLWINPSWHEPPDKEAINIQLDPGLAFGTGTHPTTALCLEWLDSCPDKGLSVIDYGCGSGILAIAAIRLGACQVQAIDNDPQALLSTRNNADKNRIGEKLATFLPDEKYPYPCDLLLANILANPLVELAQQFSRLVQYEGTVILSGILAEQATMVTRAYQPWFNMSAPQERNGWICLKGIRKQVQI